MIFIISVVDLCDRVLTSPKICMYLDWKLESWVDYAGTKKAEPIWGTSEPPVLYMALPTRLPFPLLPAISRKTLS